MAQASAPGKCILFGEHAVVYGHPAVAVALDQRISVNIEPSKDWRIDGMRFDAARHPHIKSLLQRLWEGGPPLSIKIQGDIPPASGLGSSAALSVAASAVLRCAKGRKVDGDRWAEGFSSTQPNNVYHGPWTSKSGKQQIQGADSVNTDECAILAHAVEAEAQGGKASPLDSSTCSHGGCIVLLDQVDETLDWLYTRSLNGVKWEVHSVSLNIEEDVWLVVGSTGIHAPTALQVQKLAELLEKNPERIAEIETIGMISRRGLDSLVKGDMNGVGRAMSENHLILRNLGLSCPELESLIAAAAPTSLGVKLTGAGGGGCMIALTKNPKATSEAIELAGGRTMISKFGSAGLSIEYSKDCPLWKDSE